MIWVKPTTPGVGRWGGPEVDLGGDQVAGVGITKTMKGRGGSFFVKLGGQKPEIAPTVLRMFLG